MTQIKKKFHLHESSDSDSWKMSKKIAFAYKNNTCESFIKFQYLNRAE